jgi:sugar-specific transcriptional regulator TrmB
MAMERITERLMVFGFTTDEARFYLFLSVMGPSPISSLVRRFDINRVKVYRILERLEERGLIEKIMGRPVRYAAKPIETSLQNELDNLKLRFSELEKAREEIISDWSKLALSEEGLSDEPRFRIHQGRQQIYEQLLHISDRAKEELLIVTTERDLHRLALYGIDEKLEVHVKNGIDIKIITQIESTGFDEIEGYYGFAAIRHVVLPSPVRIILIDNSESLVTVSMDDSMNMSTLNDTGLWTNSVSFISVMGVFFEALWTLASDIQSIMETIESQQIVRKLVEDIETPLLELGWMVEIPGSLIGYSGTEHTFNLVGTKADYHSTQVAFDVLLGEMFMTQITRIGAKKIDLREVHVVAVSPTAIGEREKNLAQLYGIHLIIPEQFESLMKNIIVNSVETEDV